MVFCERQIKEERKRPETFSAQIVKYIAIVGFTLTVVNDFRRFRSQHGQFSTNFHEILHTLFSIHGVTTLKFRQVLINI